VRVVSRRRRPDVTRWATRAMSDSARTVPQMDVETPRPRITSRCLRCAVFWPDIDAGMAVVSPSGKAHYGGKYGKTECGIDATGDRWWWPL
jgi:hypothetical protein